MRWCQALQDAQDKISFGDASETQLRAIISSTMEKITGRGLAMPTVRGWLEQWLSGKEGATTPATLARYRQGVTSFLSFLGPKADGRLESVTQKDVIDFRKHLQEQGKAAPTINLVVARIVAAPFKLAFSQGLIERNPMAGIPRLIERGVKRKGTFTIEQVRQLLAAADNEWRGMILCGYTAAARLSDAANLRWENIDFTSGVIAFIQAKTQRQTVVGLHPDLEEWLKTQNDRPASGPIFPGLAGHRVAGAGGLSRQFTTMMEKAGIESPVIREKRGRGKTVRALSFHSLRHTVASAVFKSKLIEQAQMHITGHTRGQTLKTYTHHDLEAIKAASSLIPRIS
jgi:integrase